MADVNDVNATFVKNIHKSLNSNRITEEESTEQIGIVPEMRSDVHEKTCENISSSAESIENCRLEKERNENNNYERTIVLAECLECEIVSDVKNKQNNEGLNSIEEVQECETIEETAEAIDDIDQSKLDESKRSTINFFCENLDELKDNLQSLEFTHNESMA